MARKKKTSAPKPLTTTRKRKRRSDEELIRDLQEKIRQVEARKAARRAQASPTIRAVVGALRSIDRAMEVAEGEGETLLRHVLGDARKPLAAHLESSGFSVPRARLPRGRRPKGAAAVAAASESSGD